ncbi:MAG TPA: LPS export ABC transporter permease LptF [Gammaproteobacteria bacterium]|nr:LPS export ABC transporter permease LptF [Gammaproteobacteria bacterium]
MRYLIISRYITLEVMLTTLAVLLVLLLISLANAFVGYLSDAAQGVLPLRLVLYVLVLNIPFLTSFLLPLAFFFGILLGLGRLYADSEMTALLASGYGPVQLLRSLLPLIALVVLITGALNFSWAPQTMHELIHTLAKAEQDLLTRLVLPGRFQKTQGGEYVIYVQAFDPETKQAQGVFIMQQKGIEQESHVVTSKTGYQWTDPVTQSRYIVLEEGDRYFGTPGAADFQQMSFDRYGVHIAQAKEEFKVRERAQTTQGLWRSAEPKARSELQWRACLSLSVVVLAIWAMLLAQIKPRQGKYANALPAILVMILYINLLILAKGWVADGYFGAMYGVVLAGLIAGIIGFARRIHTWPWNQ